MAMSQSIWLSAEEVFSQSTKNIHNAKIISVLLKNISPAFLLIHN